MRDVPTIEDRVADVYDCANAFIAAKVALEGADWASMLERTIEVDRCLAELKRACGYGDEAKVQL